MSEDALAESEHTDVDYRVQVAYTVPVEAIVDLKKGKVDRVVVINEAGRDRLACSGDTSGEALELTPEAGDEGEGRFRQMAGREVAT